MKYPHQASPLRICSPELGAKQPAQGPLAQIHRCSERGERNILPEIRLDDRANSRQTLIARIRQTDTSRRGDGNESHQQGFGLACQRSRNSRGCELDQQGTKEPVHSEDNRSVGTGREGSCIRKLKSVHSAIAEHSMLMPHVSRGEHGAIRRRRPHASAGCDCNNARTHINNLIVGMDVSRDDTPAPVLRRIRRSARPVTDLVHQRQATDTATALPSQRTVGQALW
jgi:hypothetical protein